MQENIDLVYTFDTTGSMYPCLREVRRKIAETATRLLKEIPNLRIGIIAHGDYCDRNSTYVTKHLQLTSDASKIVRFVETVGATGGGDFPECYELVMHEARLQMEWRADSKRVLAIIGDATPHPPAHNPGRLDWRKELDALTAAGILVHGVQALNRSEATSFYREIGSRTGGLHLNLNQFSEATDIMMAVAYQQQGPEALDQYEQEVVKAKRMTRSMSSIFDKLSKRDSKGRYCSIDARAVDEGRFQTIVVEYDQPIKSVVQDNGLVFKTGRGFYEFTKKETIQGKKEVVILDKETGDMYQGAAAREVLGLPEGVSTDIKPTYDKDRYTVFVQSTSNNRKLIGGTTFLYEVGEV